MSEGLVSRLQAAIEETERLYNTVLTVMDMAGDDDPESDYRLMATFIVRRCAADREIVETLVAARARKKVEWENYCRWVDGVGGEDLWVPEGAAAELIPGLEHAVQVAARGYGIEVDG